MLDLLFLRTWHVKHDLKKNDIRLSKKDAKILDAGMGFGQYSWYLANRYKKAAIKGVDVKDEQVEDCNKFFTSCGRNNANFEVADLTKFSEKNSYDFILSVDVMEHIEDDVQVFRNFYAALKKSGFVMISTPSDQGGSDVHEHDHHENDGSHSFIDEHVRDGYNIDEIQQKLKNAGFSKTSARYSYGKSGQFAWKLSMKYPILMLNVSKIFFVIIPFYYILTFWLCLILNKVDVLSKHKSGTGLIVIAEK